MKTTQQTGIDFLTNEICTIFSINTKDRSKYHKEIWCMFNAIQNRKNLEGFTDEDLCKRINISFDIAISKKSVIDTLTEKILLFIEKYLHQTDIEKRHTHRLVWEKLHQHKSVSIGDFM